MNINLKKFESYILSKQFLDFYCILLIIESILMILANFALINQHFINSKFENWIEKVIFFPSLNLFFGLFWIQVFLLNKINGIDFNVLRLLFPMAVFVVMISIALFFRYRKIMWETKEKRRILFYSLQALSAMFIPLMLQKLSNLSDSLTFHVKTYLISLLIIVFLVSTGFLYQHYLRRNK